MKQTISERTAIVRGWLAEMWPRRQKAAHVAQQYRLMLEMCPDAVADLMTFACAFDSTVGLSPDATLINTGKREVALHLITMSRLTPADLRHLEERTTDQNE